MDADSVKEARSLYEERGWKMAHIAVFLGVNRSSIFYHIQFDGWVRRVPMVRKMPEEVAEVYRKQRRENAARRRGSYAYESFREEQRRIGEQEKCEHKLWSIRCACCGKILGSESRAPDPFVFEVMQRLNSNNLHIINPKLCLK